MRLMKCYIFQNEKSLLLFLQSTYQSSVDNYPLSIHGFLSQHLFTHALFKNTHAISLMVDSK